MDVTQFVIIEHFDLVSLVCEGMVVGWVNLITCFLYA